MNRFATLAAIGLMSATSFAGASFASDKASSLDHDIATTKMVKFQLQDISSIAKSDPNYTAYNALTPKSPGVHKLQASIESNKTLMKALKADKVEINNIVAAKKAEDGGLTFYVR
ncbi:hypothetical protein ACQQ2Q_00785 [Agrobacterium sp. ES01]|uniref:hypothetical protein n=1 Tax=Agrobacterium sp. ES01 TaxID=3420714 RepID=UPI003D1217D1